MRKVYKYPVGDAGGVIETHRGAEPLHVGEQDGRLTLWLRVDTAEPIVGRWIITAPTGATVGVVPHLGTVLLSDGLVCHVFDGGER